MSGLPFSPAPPGDAVEGWNGNHPSLHRLITASGSKVAIDVGVWKGQSTINLALSLKNAHTDGCVTAVDTFLGSAEHWNRDRELFERRHGQPDLFQTFLSNAINAGVADYIIPMPQTSTTAAASLRRSRITASLAHINAAHGYAKALRDIEEYWEILEPGGYLIGDDYDASWPGVIQAAGEFSTRTRRPLAIEWPK